MNASLNKSENFLLKTRNCRGNMSSMVIFCRNYDKISLIKYTVDFCDQRMAANKQKKNKENKDGRFTIN